MKLAVIGGSGLDEVTGLEPGQSHRIMTAWGRPSDAVGSCAGPESIRASITDVIWRERLNPEVRFIVYSSASVS